MTDSTPNDAGSRPSDADESERRHRDDERANVPSLPELLLAIPQDNGEFERMRSKLRPVDFFE